MEHELKVFRKYTAMLSKVVHIIWLSIVFKSCSFFSHFYSISIYYYLQVPYLHYYQIADKMTSLIWLIIRVVNTNQFFRIIFTFLYKRNIFKKHCSQSHVYHVISSCLDESSMPKKFFSITYTFLCIKIISFKDWYQSHK